MSAAILAAEPVRKLSTRPVTDAAGSNTGPGRTTEAVMERTLTPVLRRPAAGVLKW
ncbi:hypothetical protein GCM10011348_25810 [Marinobacterium nitratireducens]|uniref:Uncharacterized protein n=1 Tax=Marinobacterium nitratireducens TaxID=518897 RepID=A0A917ZHS7_9GAMM|nr:hypothetical protein GCM10011348_25810 [Marinobacterium nitratireducens]